MKINNKKLSAFLICIVVIVVVASAMLIKHFAIGPRYINDSALLDERIVYYMGNNYHYCGFASFDYKSGKCIKRGLFETFYLTEGSDDYIINSQIHERFLYIKEDKIKDKYRLTGEDNDITYENNKLLVNGDEYTLLDKVDKSMGNYVFEEYKKCGTVIFNSKELDVLLLKGDFDCDFLTIFDRDTFINYIFTSKDVDMTAYNAEDYTKITACYYYGVNIDRQVTSDEKVLNAIKSLTGNNSKRPAESIYEYNPSGKKLFIDLVYGDLPICKKNHIDIAITDYGIYYSFNNFQTRNADNNYWYVTDDEEVINAFTNLYENEEAAGIQNEK